MRGLAILLMVILSLTAPPAGAQSVLRGIVLTEGGDPIRNADDFPVVSLQGIELYLGPSELPTQFQATGSACGALLLWSRTGEP